MADVVDLVSSDEEDTDSRIAFQGSGLKGDPCDLVSPSPSPERDEGTVEVAGGKRKAATAGMSEKALGKLKAARHDSDSDEDDDLEGDHGEDAAAPAMQPDHDDEAEEVMEVDAIPRPVRQAVVATSADDDEDIVFTGRAGHNALSDFPHSRENCIEFPFQLGREHTCCANCAPPPQLPCASAESASPSSLPLALCPPPLRRLLLRVRRRGGQVSLVEGALQGNPHDASVV